MDGAFRSDFTRDTFDRLNHLSRVLEQQGRVHLEAEWNDQVDILLYYLRALTKDLVGPRVVRPDIAFQVTATADKPGQSAIPAQTVQTTGQTKVRRSAKDKTPRNPPDFYVWPGHYYIDGLLVENEGCESDTCKIDGTEPCPCPYVISCDQKSGSSQKAFVVYLDAWERQVTYIEDKEIREVALGVLGPDTTTRAKIVWQVKVAFKTPSGQDLPILENNDHEIEKKDVIDFDTNWERDWIDELQPAKPFRGMLKAGTSGDAMKDTSPCIIPPDSRSRGAENQLYRVEIQDPGLAGKATFKWSRENGSVVFPIIGKVEGNIVKLEHLGRDKRFGLKKDDWVEIVDDAILPLDTTPPANPPPLFQIDSVDYVHSQVKLKTGPGDIGQDFMKYPILRRWEHFQGDPKSDGNLTPGEGTTVIVENQWFPLEDGIQIQFQSKDQVVPESQSQLKGESGKTSEQLKASGPSRDIMYRTGDHWLIPARTATGDVEWPRNDKKEPIAVEPHGVEHHYAPLAYVILNIGGRIDRIADLRRTLYQLWTGPAGFATSAVAAEPALGTGKNPKS